MIVPSMNTQELVKEILKDLPMVDRKAKYLSEELRRKAVKSKDKCYFQMVEYKSNRQNNWLIVINYHKGLPTFCTVVYYLNEHGISGISIGEQNRMFKYSPHFLIRYNERFLKQENISKLDLLKRFISHNKAGIAEVNDINQYLFCRFTEGIGLGILEVIGYHTRLFHLKTFISNQMVFEDQQQSIIMAHDYYEKYGQELQKYVGVKSL